MSEIFSPTLPPTAHAEPVASEPAVKRAVASPTTAPLRVVRAD